MLNMAQVESVFATAGLYCREPARATGDRACTRRAVSNAKFSRPRVPWTHTPSGGLWLEGWRNLGKIIRFLWELNYLSLHWLINHEFPIKSAFAWYTGIPYIPCIYFQTHCDMQGTSFFCQQLGEENLVRIFLANGARVSAGTSRRFEEWGGGSTSMRRGKPGKPKSKFSN